MARLLGQTGQESTGQGSMCLTGHCMESACSAQAGAMRDLMVGAACDAGWHLRCGTGYIPHVQFRRERDERPYPFALNVNRDVPTVYVRRPTAGQRLSLIEEYDGAHVNNDGEVKIPIPDMRTARRVLADVMMLPIA